MASGYNPEFNPTGIEGGIDTNQLPWLDLPQQTGLAIKPLRASNESGMFSAILKVSKGVAIRGLVHLGAADLYMLSGSLKYDGGDLKADVTPAMFGYIPANVQLGVLEAREDAELLINCYGPLAFTADDGQPRTLLTALHVQRIAAEAGVTLVPNTLAECMQPRPEPFSGQAAPLAIAASGGDELLQASPVEPSATNPGHPHFIDTRSVEWIVNPGLPDIALKILRVSEETGITSLLVRHNGVAGPHYHLGAADFLVLSGHIGYRAGPPEGYGPGVWFYEPAGARHEATQRIGDDVDLIYTANVYGPVQFDEGPDTAITAVQSWMQYKALADAQGLTLVRNTLERDHTWLASAG